MVGPGVLSVSVTVSVEVTRPPPRSSLFPYTTLFRSPLATALVVYPDATAIALIVWVVVTVIGPVYAAEVVVGVLPMVAEDIVAPGVLSVSVTESEEVNVPPPGLSPSAAAVTWAAQGALAPA